MAYLVSMEPEHLKEFERDPDSPDTTVVDFFGPVDQRIERYLANGSSVSMLDEKTGRVLGCGGCIILCKNKSASAEAWLVVSRMGRQHPKDLFKSCKFFLEQFEMVTPCHRIQATVVQPFPAANRFAMRLGFVPEGTMIAYGPNKENYIRYVRLS